MDLFMGNSLWYLIVQSDAISKCVLLLLLGMSVMCWAVFFGKIALMHLKKRQLLLVGVHIKKVDALQELILVATEHAGTLPGYLISKNLSFLNMIFKLGQTKELTNIECDMMLTHLDQTVDSVVQQEKSYLAILSTSAGVAPLLGLFGTVWGLIHAFMRISEKQVADITTVAPGIAEALLTTLAGLLVAIPAMVMFNYLQMQVRTIEQQSLAITDHIALIVQQLTIRKSHAQNETSATRTSDVDGYFTHPTH